jgi:hypothetical protein
LTSSIGSNRRREASFSSRKLSSKKLPLRTWASNPQTIGQDMPAIFEPLSEKGEDEQKKSALEIREQLIDTQIQYKRQLSHLSNELLELFNPSAVLTQTSERDIKSSVDRIISNIEKLHLLTDTSALKRAVNNTDARTAIDLIKTKLHRNTKAMKKLKSCFTILCHIQGTRPYDPMAINIKVSKLPPKISNAPIQKKIKVKPKPNPLLNFQSEINRLPNFDRSIRSRELDIEKYQKRLETLNHKREGFESDLVLIRTKTRLNTEKLATLKADKVKAAAELNDIKEQKPALLDKLNIILGMLKQPLINTTGKLPTDIQETLTSLLEGLPGEKANINKALKLCQRVSDIEVLETKLDRITASVDKFEQNSVRYKKDSNEIAEQIQQTQHKMDAMTGKLGTAKERLVRLQSSLRSYKRDSVLLKTEVNNAVRKNIQYSDSQLRVLENKIRRLSDQKAGFETELHSLDSEIKDSVGMTSSTKPKLLIAQETNTGNQEITLARLKRGLTNPEINLPEFIHACSAYKDKYNVSQLLTQLIESLGPISKKIDVECVTLQKLLAISKVKEQNITDIRDERNSRIDGNRKRIELQELEYTPEQQTLMTQEDDAKISELKDEQTSLQETIDQLQQAKIYFNPDLDGSSEIADVFTTIESGVDILASFLPKGKRPAFFPKLRLLLAQKEDGLDASSDLQIEGTEIDSAIKIISENTEDHLLRPISTAISNFGKSLNTELLRVIVGTSDLTLETELHTSDLIAGEADLSSYTLKSRFKEFLTQTKNSELLTLFTDETKLLSIIKFTLKADLSRRTNAVNTISRATTGTRPKTEVLSSPISGLEEFATLLEDSQMTRKLSTEGLESAATTLNQAKTVLVDMKTVAGTISTGNLEKLQASLATLTSSSKELHSQSKSEISGLIEACVLLRTAVEDAKTEHGANSTKHKEAQAALTEKQILLNELKSKWDPLLAQIRVFRRHAETQVGHISVMLEQPVFQSPLIKNRFAFLAPIQGVPTVESATIIQIQKQIRTLADYQDIILVKGTKKPKGLLFSEKAEENKSNLQKSAEALVKCIQQEISTSHSQTEKNVAIKHAIEAFLEKLKEQEADSKTDPSSIIHRTTVDLHAKILLAVAYSNIIERAEVQDIIDGVDISSKVECSATSAIERELIPDSPAVTAHIKSPRVELPSISEYTPINIKLYLAALKEKLESIDLNTLKKEQRINLIAKLSQSLQELRLNLPEDLSALNATEELTAITHRKLCATNLEEILDFITKESYNFRDTFSPHQIENQTVTLLAGYDTLIQLKDLTAEYGAFGFGAIKRKLDSLHTPEARALLAKISSEPHDYHADHISLVSTNSIFMDVNKADMKNRLLSAFFNEIYMHSSFDPEKHPIIDESFEIQEEHPQYHTLKVNININGEPISAIFEYSDEGYLFQQPIITQNDNKFTLLCELAKIHDPKKRVDLARSEGFRGSDRGPIGSIASRENILSLISASDGHKFQIKRLVQVFTEIGHVRELFEGPDSDAIQTLFENLVLEDNALKTAEKADLEALINFIDDVANYSNIESKLNKSGSEGLNEIELKRFAWASLLAFRVNNLIPSDKEIDTDTLTSIEAQWNGFVQIRQEASRSISETQTGHKYDIRTQYIYLVHSQLIQLEKLTPGKPVDKATMFNILKASRECQQLVDENSQDSEEALPCTDIGLKVRDLLRQFEGMFIAESKTILETGPIMKKPPSTDPIDISLKNLNPALTDKYALLRPLLKATKRNNIIPRHIINLINQKWDYSGDSGIFFHKDTHNRTYEINIFTGQCYIDGQLLGETDGRIMDHAAYQELFGSKDLMPHLLEAKKGGYSACGKGRYTFQYNGTSDALEIYYKEEDDSHVKLIPQYELVPESTDIPSSSGDFLVPTKFHSFVRTIIDRENLHAWQDSTGTKITLRDNTGNTIYTLERSSHSGPLSITRNSTDETIHLLKGTSGRSDISPEIQSFLHGTNIDHQVTLLTKDDDRRIEIEFNNTETLELKKVGPHFQFELDDMQFRLISSRNPQNFGTIFEGLFETETLQDILLFENINSHDKMFLLRSEVETDEETPKVLQSYHAFHVNTDNSITPRTRAAGILLALHYFKKGSVSQALEILSSEWPSTNFSVEETALLSEFSRVSDLTPDQSALLIYLRGKQLKVLNADRRSLESRNTQEPSTLFATKLAQEYKTFFSQKGDISPALQRHLNIENLPLFERSLLDFIDINSTDIDTTTYRASLPKGAIQNKVIPEALTEKAKALTHRITSELGGRHSILSKLGLNHLCTVVKAHAEAPSRSFEEMLPLRADTSPARKSIAKQQAALKEKVIGTNIIPASYDWHSATVTSLKTDLLPALETQQQVLETKIQYLETGLLKLVKELNFDPPIAATITLEDVIVLLLQNKIEFREDQAHTKTMLQNLAMQYLATVTDFRQISQATSIITSATEETPLTENQLKDLGDLLTRDRIFDLSSILEGGDADKRLLTLSVLYVEYNQGFRLTPEQGKFLRALTSGDPTRQQIAQMRTGFGKTDVFLATFALYLANGTKLVRFCAPDALTALLRSDLNPKLKNIFMNRVVPFEFNSRKKTDLPYLQGLRKEIETCRERGAILVSSHATDHHIGNALNEIKTRLTQLHLKGANIREIEELENAMLEIIQIMQLFQGDNYIEIADEVDKIFNPDRTTNTLGQETTTISTVKLSLAKHIMEAAVSHFDTPDMICDESTYHRDHKTAIAKQVVTSLLEEFQGRFPALGLEGRTAYMIEYIGNRTSVDQPKAEIAHFKNLDIDVAQLLIDLKAEGLLTSDNAVTSKCKELLNHNEEIEFSVKSKGTYTASQITAIALVMQQIVSFQQQLNYLKHGLNKYLPNTISPEYRVDVDYGLSAKKGLHYATPREEANIASQDSEFEDIDSNIFCTFRMIYSKKLQTEDEKQLVLKYLIDNHSNILIDSLPKPLQTLLEIVKSEVAKAETFNPKNLLKKLMTSLDRILPGTTKTISDVFEIINAPENSHSLSFIIEHMILKTEVQLRTQIFRSDCYDYLGSDASITGISATPPEQEILPPGIGKNGILEMDGLESTVFQRMADETPAIVIEKINESSWQGIIDGILAKGFGEDNFQMFIDAAALLTGISNEKVARYMLGKLKSLGREKNVIYFKKPPGKAPGQLMILKVDGSEMPTTPSRLADDLQSLGGSENTVIFADKQRSTGLDTKKAQLKNALIGVTCGPTTTETDKTQADGRGRMLDKGQKVVSIITETYSDTIKESVTTESLDVDGTIKGKHVLAQIMKQTFRLNDLKKFRTMKMQLANLLKRTAQIESMKVLLELKQLRLSGGSSIEIAALKKRARYLTTYLVNDCTKNDLSVYDTVEGEYSGEELTELFARIQLDTETKYKRIVGLATVKVSDEEFAKIKLIIDSRKDIGGPIIDSVSNGHEIASADAESEAEAVGEADADSDADAVGEADADSDAEATGSADKPQISRHNLLTQTPKRKTTIQTESLALLEQLKKAPDPMTVLNSSDFSVSTETIKTTKDIDLIQFISTLKMENVRFSKNWLHATTDYSTSDHPAYRRPVEYVYAKSTPSGGLQLYVLTEKEAQELQQKKTEAWDGSETSEGWINLQSTAKQTQLINLKIFGGIANPEEMRISIQATDGGTESIADATEQIIRTPDLASLKDRGGLCALVALSVEQNRAHSKPGIKINGLGIGHNEDIQFTMTFDSTGITLEGGTPSHSQRKTFGAPSESRTIEADYTAYDIRDSVHAGFKSHYKSILDAQKTLFDRILDENDSKTRKAKEAEIRLRHETRVSDIREALKEYDRTTNSRQTVLTQEKERIENAFHLRASEQIQEKREIAIDTIDSELGRIRTIYRTKQREITSSEITRMNGHILQEQAKTKALQTQLESIDNVRLKNEEKLKYIKNLLRDIKARQRALSPKQKTLLGHYNSTVTSWITTPDAASQKHVIATRLKLTYTTQEIEEVLRLIEDQKIAKQEEITVRSQLQANADSSQSAIEERESIALQIQKQRLLIKHLESERKPFLTKIHELGFDPQGYLPSKSDLEQTEITTPYYDDIHALERATGDCKSEERILEESLLAVSETWNDFKHLLPALQNSKETIMENLAAGTLELDLFTGEIDKLTATALLGDESSRTGNTVNIATANLLVTYKAFIKEQIRLGNANWTTAITSRNALFESADIKKIIQGTMSEAEILEKARANAKLEISEILEYKNSNPSSHLEPSYTSIYKEICQADLWQTTNRGAHYAKYNPSTPFSAVEEQEISDEIEERRGDPMAVAAEKWYRLFPEEPWLYLPFGQTIPERTEELAQASTANHASRWIDAASSTEVLNGTSIAHRLQRPLEALEEFEFIFQQEGLEFDISGLKTQVIAEIKKAQSEWLSFQTAQKAELDEQLSVLKQLDSIRTLALLIEPDSVGKLTISDVDLISQIQTSLSLIQPPTAATEEIVELVNSLTPDIHGKLSQTQIANLAKLPEQINTLRATTREHLLENPDSTSHKAFVRKQSEFILSFEERLGELFEGIKEQFQTQTVETEFTRMISTVQGQLSALGKYEEEVAHSVYANAFHEPTVTEQEKISVGWTATAQKEIGSSLLSRKPAKPTIKPEPKAVVSVGTSSLVQTQADIESDHALAWQMQYADLADSIYADHKYALKVSENERNALELRKTLRLAREESASAEYLATKPSVPKASVPKSSVPKLSDTPVRAGSVVRGLPEAVSIRAHSGLMNVRADCFANSIVQSIASPKFLANLHALDEEHEGLVAPLDPIQTRRKAYLTETGGARARCIAFVTELINPTRSMVEIRDLKRAFYTSLPNIGEINFGNGYADADEFVRGLLDGVGLTQRCLRSTLLTEDDVVIGDPKVEPIAHIQVPIIGLETETVASAVTKFFSRETLHPDDRRGAQHGKRIVLEHAPDILPVNLKRTEFFRKGHYPTTPGYTRVGPPLEVTKGKGLTAVTEEVGAVYKITKPMTLSPEITVPLASGETATYRLKAVSCHRPGHYVAAVSYEDPETHDTHWVDHNDSAVGFIGSGEDPGALRASIRSEAYVLIYEKQD